MPDEEALKIKAKDKGNYEILDCGFNKEEDHKLHQEQGMMNTEIYALTNETDYIDISEKYEKLFKNCIISLAMIYATAYDSDENHSGYEKQYEDSPAVLLNRCIAAIWHKADDCVK